MKRRGRRAAVLLVTGAIALSAAVAGYAYWTSDGTGSATLEVGTAGAWQVTSTAASGGPLSPNGPAQTVTYYVKNTSSGNASLTDVTVSVANTDGTPWTSGTCSKADFSVGGAGAGNAFVDDRLAGTFSGGGSDNATVVVQMVDTGGNQDGCQGVTVPLYFAAS